MTVSAASLVKETSTTTGTGNYTLGGAATNHRTFASVVTPSATALVPYIARMGAEFEAGIGLLSASSTLQRVGIYESSNSGSAVNWAAGTKEIYMGNGGAAQATGRHNVLADNTLQPGVGDNYADGYSYGSLWRQTVSGRSVMWICTNPGAPGLPNATWQVFAVPYNAMLPMLTDGVLATDGYPGGIQIGYGDDYVKSGSGAYGVTGVGGGGVTDWSGALLQGTNFGWSTLGESQTVRIGGVANTTDATTTAIDWMGDGAQTTLPIQASTALAFTGRVVVREEATGDCKAWDIAFLIKRASTGDPALVGSLTKTVIAADAGASAWDIAVAIDTANDGVQLTVTGEAAHTLRWSAGVTVTQVMAA